MGFDQSTAGGVDGEDISPASVETGAASIESLPASYHVYTDGTNVYAEPQADGLGRYEGTAIQPVLESARDDLPGGTTEASGKIELKRGEYPGTLSNFVLPSQLHIVGEMQSHYDESGTDPIPPDNPPVRIECSGDAFVAPDVNTDLTIYPRVADIELSGDGTGVAFQNESRSNTWDWMFIERVVAQGFVAPFRFDTGSLDTPVFIRGCQFRQITGRATLGSNSVIRDSGILGSGGGYLEVVDGAVVDCPFIAFTGETNAAVELSGRGALKGSTVYKNGGTDGNGTAVEHLSGNGRVIGNTFGRPDGADFGRHVDVSGGAFPTVALNTEGAIPATESIRWDGNSGAQGGAAYGNRATAGINVTGGATPVVNGTVQFGTTPTNSDVDANQAGAIALDTSTSPEDIYVVLQDGTLAGPL
jgi:hypothetical protein